MNILVTGGCGFVGSAVVRLLVCSGHNVVNIDKLTYAGSLRSVEEIARARNYAFIHGDIRDTGLLAATFDKFHPGAVVHLAAESHVDRSIVAPEAFIETNITG